MGGVERGTGAAELRRGGSARRRRRSGAPEDVAAVRQVLRAGDEPSVVAHSYGGIVTAEAAAGVGSVRHLLLVSSYLPEAGQSLSDSADGSPAPFLDVAPRRRHVRGPPCSWTRSCRTAPPRSRRRRRTTSPGRACGGPSSRSGLPQGSRCPRRTSSAPRTGAPRHGCSGSSPAGPAASSSSTPATTRSCLSLKRSGYLFAEPVTAAADEPGRRSEGQEAAVQPGHRRHRHPHRTEVRMALLKGAGIGGTPHHSLLGRAPEAGSLNTVPVERRIRPRASARSGRTGGHSRRAAGRGYGPPGRLPRVA